MRNEARVCARARRFRVCVCVCVCVEFSSFPTRARGVDRWTDERWMCARAGVHADGTRGKPRARGFEIEREDEDATRDEATLRGFDLTSAYGPCLGLTRLERWDRAVKYGLDPPKAVLEALQRRGSAKARWRECVWYGRV